MAHLLCTLLCIAVFFTLQAPVTSPTPTLHRLLLHNNGLQSLVLNNNKKDINSHNVLHNIMLDNNHHADGGRGTDIIELYDSHAHALHLDATKDHGDFSSSDNIEFGGGFRSMEMPTTFNNESQDLTLLSSPSCDPTYGMMPCSDTVIGNLVLVAVYGFLLFMSAKMLSEGSELLLTVLDAGIIGGLLLPILGALPDSILILVSGLGGTKSEAQEQVLVGIGLLAGSIVMLLTLLWGSCLILGRCDLEVDANSGKTKAVDKKLSKSLGCTDTGVEIDELTQLSARISIISVVPYIVAQLPRIFGFSANGNIPVLIACILACSGLLAYCLYQVFTPYLQQRQKEIAQRRVLKFLAIEKLMRHVGDERLVDDAGNLNKDYAQRLFKQIDRNHDGIVNYDELRAMLSVSMIHGQGTEDIIRHFMEEFDENKNENISGEEFVKGMQKWCSELKIKGKPIAEYRQHAENFMDELRSLEEDDDDDDSEREKPPPSKKQLIRNAVFLMAGGTIIAAVFADPLVDAVDAFSTASNIPSFFVSFVLLPLASNSSEAVSCIMFSSRKKKKNASLTYSQIYGAVTMNSTMGLGIFLAVVYTRQLVWDFSSEVLVIIIVTVVMGLMGSFRKVFPLWMAVIALLLYPLSLCLVAILDYVAGWE